MSTVLSPNLFITNDFDVIREYFLVNENNKTIKDLPKNSLRQLLICGNQNKYLQSFEYSVNYDQPEVQVLTLDFVDTDGLFEDYMFISHKDQLYSLAENALAQGKDTEKAFVEAFSILSQGHNLYVSFGIGPNLADWSDPTIFYMYKMTIDVANGLRKYKCLLYPSNNVLFRPRLKLNLQKPNPDREFQFAKQSQEAIAAIPVAEVKDDSESMLVYKLLKRYVKNLTSCSDDEIITILPDFTLSAVETSSILNLETFQKTFGIKKETLHDAFEWTREMLNRPSMSPNLSILQAMQEQASKTTLNEEPLYTIRSGKIKDGSIHPTLPDWYQPIDNISIALKGIYKNSDDLVIIEENNLKILNFWKSIGLFSASTSSLPPRRAIIIGPELLVDHYLYNNGGDLNDITNIPQTISTPLIKNTKEYNILQQNRDFYTYNFSLLNSKRKIGSSFGESPITDELQLYTSDLMKLELKNQAYNPLQLELLDIPVFTNNFKNSNILSFSLDNSDQYFAGMNVGIRNNTIRFFYDAAQRKMSQLNFRNTNIQSIADTFASVISNLKSFVGKQISLDIQNDIPIQTGYGPLPGKPTKKFVSILSLDDYFRIIKDILIQQIYFMKNSDSPFKFDDTESDFARFLQQRDYFNQLSLIEKPIVTNFQEIATQESIPKDLQYKNFAEYYVIREKYNTKKILAELKKLGFSSDNLYSPETIKTVLSELKNSGFFRQFGTLIINSNGNLDYRALSLAKSIRELISPDLTLLQIEKMQTSEDLKSAAKDAIDLTRQKQDFELAIIFMTLYKIEIRGGSYSPSDSLSDTFVGKKINPDRPAYTTYVNFIPKSFKLDSDNLFAEMVKYTSNQTYKLTLKTLPFFHISTIRKYLFRPALVFSKKVKATGLNKIASSETSNLELDFFTGIYNITGFKHVINTTDCYSQFYLTKRTARATSN